MDDTDLATHGWHPLLLTTDLARTYGLPTATHGYRRQLTDGYLVALLEHTINGHAVALTHLRTLPDIPGRMPTLSEVYAARVQLIPRDVLMVAILEPMSYALRIRWDRARTALPMPHPPGLPTTVKCVQMYVEGLTDDVVFGTEDIPSPATVWPVIPRYDPVGPLSAPTDLLGDPTITDTDDNGPHDGEW